MAEGQYDTKTEKVEFEIKSDLKNKKRLAIITVVVILMVFIAITVAAVILSKSSESDGNKGNYNTNESVILLISMDGLRHDYLKLGITPNFDKFALRGVKADFLRPVFPTLTFPNHYSQVTGLYPESHGIVANSFLDETGDLFKLGSPKMSLSKWWGGEPIWVTAVKQGLKTACFFWPGSEASIKGIRPTYWKKYNSKVPFSTRVEQVIEWLKLTADKRPRFVTLYFKQPDYYSHADGVLRPKPIQMIKTLDTLLGDLMSKLEADERTKRVNVIITSDHGMTCLNCSDVVYIKNDVSNATVVGRGTASFLYPKTNESGLQLYDQLKCLDEHVTAFYKHNIFTPRRMHFTNNRRIGDITLMPDLHWQVLYGNDTCRSSYKASHGFDNIHQDMQGIFLAAGPAFKKNYRSGHFQNIELYNLFAGLTPAPNNGTYGSLHHLLKPEVLTSLKPQMNTYYKTRNCSFPNDYEQAKKDCKYCECSYCDKNISAEMDNYRKNLNLSDEQVSISHQMHFPFALPQTNTVKPYCILTQKHYVIAYDENLHLPAYVGYQLTKKQLETNVKRLNCFRRDIRLNYTQSSICSAYTRSGYDRGHMAPAGDFNFEQSALQDTNILSNIAPQSPSFNRFGSWRYLEDLTRNLTFKYKLINVVSGTIFDENNDGLMDGDTIPKRWLKNVNKSVAIPTHFYKILMKCRTALQLSQCSVDDVDTLTFIVPHSVKKLCKLRSLSVFVWSHVATIRDVELLTGLTFFPSLTLAHQAKIKTALNTEIWSF